jgi:hypothetical protein
VTFLHNLDLTLCKRYVFVIPDLIEEDVRLANEDLHNKKCFKIILVNKVDILVLNGQNLIFLFFSDQR